jgi:hypothetical protein
VAPPHISYVVTQHFDKNFVYRGKIIWKYKIDINTCIKHHKFKFISQLCTAGSVTGEEVALWGLIGAIALNNVIRESSLLFILAFAKLCLILILNQWNGKSFALLKKRNSYILPCYCDRSSIGWSPSPKEKCLPKRNEKGSSIVVYSLTIHNLRKISSLRVLSSQHDQSIETRNSYGPNRFRFTSS